MLSKGEKNMNKVAIMTDSNSGISLQQAKEMNCFMLNMPIILNQNTYIENENIELSTTMQESTEEISEEQ